MRVWSEHAARATLPYKIPRVVAMSICQVNGNVKMSGGASSKIWQTSVRDSISGVFDGVR
jgi:hypothetical protein